MTTEPNPGIEGVLGNNTKALLVFFSLLNSSTLTFSAGVSHLQLPNRPRHVGKPGQAWQTLNINTKKYD